jgi:hypothetical protein
LDNRLVDPFPQNAAPAQFVERVTHFVERQVGGLVVIVVTVMAIDDERVRTAPPNLVNVHLAGLIVDFDDAGLHAFQHIERVVRMVAQMDGKLGWRYASSIKRAKGAKSAKELFGLSGHLAIYSNLPKRSICCF